jgi:glycerol uptake operon antiterminator
MLTQASTSLLNLPARHVLVPVVETRAQFHQALETPAVRVLLLHHCNIFEFSTLLDRAFRAGCSVYVNIDHIDGVYPDAAGFRYLGERLHVRGVLSSHPKVLASAKESGLETIQRIFAIDSTGLRLSLASVEPACVDMLDFAPAGVLPHIMPRLQPCLTLPYMASGLLCTGEQLQAVLGTGVRAVAVSDLDRWL